MATAKRSTSPARVRARGFSFFGTVRGFLEQLEDFVNEGEAVQATAERIAERLVPVRGSVELPPELLSRIARVADALSSRSGRRIGIVQTLEMLVATAERGIVAARDARNGAAHKRARKSSV